MSKQTDAIIADLKAASRHAADVAAKAKDLKDQLATVHADAAATDEKVKKLQDDLMKSVASED